MNRNFARLVVGAMILGIAVGWACNATLPPAEAARATALFSLLMEAFLRLVRMIIAPLVFTTLLAGIAHMEDAAAVGRVGIKTLAWFLLASVVSLLLGLVLVALLRRQARPVLAAVRDPALLAFSVASSDAAYPRLMTALPGAGIPRRIVSFVLPLGYAFNLDGSMMYCTFAALFILQAHGVTLSWAQQAGMLGMLLVTSKGIAGVPRASLVVIMATLASLGFPEGWIGLVLAVDHLLDMGRSATNVLGNAVAAAVVSKWEDVFDKA